MTKTGLSQRAVKTTQPLCLLEEEILAFRLQHFSLLASSCPSGIAEAMGGWVMQNTPPGAWESALHTRMPSLPLSALEEALCVSKSLIQTWSLRGAPCIFSIKDRDIFLSALIPETGEDWIYIRGISGALEHLQLTLEELLPLVEQAALLLDTITITSKSSLDHVLAQRIAPLLPSKTRERWHSPSLYGEDQTMGEAAVSFLLRPCALKQLVVFGKKEKTSPTFTSMKNWYKDTPLSSSSAGNATEALVKRYLHCYGPATPQMFADTLGCSLRQAKRMLNTVSPKLLPVRTPLGISYIPEEEREAFSRAKACLPPPDSPLAIRLVPPHDPFLDAKDRKLLLPDMGLQRKIWKITGNPGAVLINGRIAGLWKTRKVSSALQAEAELWQPITGGQKKEMERWFSEYASFRALRLHKLDITGPS